MSYQFETLGDERFQQLCQAVLVCSHPNVQCLPVGQRDGGRDAFLRRRKKNQPNTFVVFQVKYVRDPQTREARDLVDDVIRTEKPKVERLIERGASAYYLMTNVLGTSYLDHGSIDKVNSVLTEALNIEAHCWWRDDIERRIDGNPSIKWSYPEILRATDLLEALIEGNTGSAAIRRTQALRSYMAYQANYDSQLKFKQVDLQKNIIDLFVDVPARVVAPPNAEGRARWSYKLSDLKFEDRSFDTSMVIHGDPDDEELETIPGAQQLLANADFARGFSKVVIEGAPGQGKSTVTQYLCQLHRLLLLNRKPELDRAAQLHKPGEARIPFRVDIRDYASWIAGRDPFSDDPSARLPVGSNPILESFLAGQVHRYTGMEFTVDDLTAMMSASQVLIVLDGFDEVADVPTRNRIVAEVSDAAVRIDALALSTQIVVTSRPAAFANSPGFPAEEWQHVQLLALSHRAIHAYAERWLDGRGADAREKRTVVSVLKQKLEQPHVRDLARNPMQLAILLALISVQGASLPDKRTALYDKYIDIFLNREAEKSTVVRDYRDLLVQIHQYLAWVLQVDAETNAGAGHIAESRLRECVRVFLEQRGHQTTLVDDLFSGMVERVVALVSRVQGTYEFEVQPLREYFAARYLYDTAPYSPSGAQRRGTLPERFDAIARNFYWLNVARFYAGCYSSGELASLLDGIEEIGASEQFRYISHIPQLGATLLSDYVFSQQPRLAAKLASRVAKHPGFRLLLATGYSRRIDRPLTLPPGTAQSTLVDACKQLLQTDNLRGDTTSIVAETLVANLTPDAVYGYWTSLRSTLHGDGQWIRIGNYLQIFGRMSKEDCAGLPVDQQIAVTEALIRNDRFEVLDAQPERWKTVIDDILDDPARRFPLWARVARRTTKLAACFWALFSGDLFDGLSEVGDESALVRLLERFSPSRFGEERANRSPAAGDDIDTLMPREFVGKMEEFLETTVGQLKASGEPWLNFIESARSIWGERWAFCRMAVDAVALVKTPAANDCTLADEGVPLFTRACRARQAATDPQWWIKELASAQELNTVKQQFALYALHRLMPVDQILSLSDTLSAALDRLPEKQWLGLTSNGIYVPFRRLGRQYGSRQESFDH